MIIRVLSNDYFASQPCWEGEVRKAPQIKPCVYVVCKQSGPTAHEEENTVSEIKLRRTIMSRTRGYFKGGNRDLLSD